LLFLQALPLVHTTEWDRTWRCPLSVLQVLLDYCFVQRPDDSRQVHG
jgi:hypothetical protein